jgi:hypothetical protein
MNEAAALAFAAAVPFLLLGLLLWLARLEDTLGDGLATQTPDPALTVDADAVQPIPAQPVPAAAAPASAAA